MRESGACLEEDERPWIGSRDVPDLHHFWLLTHLLQFTDFHLILQFPLLLRHLHFIICTNERTSLLTRLYPDAPLMSMSVSSSSAITALTGASVFAPFSA